MSFYRDESDYGYENETFEAKLKMIKAVAFDEKVSDKNFREAVKSLLEDKKPTLSTQWDR